MNLRYELFKEIGQQLKINIKTITTESPWSNEIAEKKNGVIGNMLKKVISYAVLEYGVVLELPQPRA